MNTKLITALEKVIEGLESDTVHYDWYQQHSCNCGLVAQAITGMSFGEMAQELSGATDDWRNVNGGKRGGGGPCWTDMMAMYCPLTGVPIKEVFRQLMDAGLTRIDIAYLEALSDPRVVKLSGITGDKVQRSIDKRFLFWNRKVTKMVPYYATKSNLLPYLKAWVSLLKEGSPVARAKAATEKEQDRLIKQLELESLKDQERKAVTEQRYEDAHNLQNQILKLTNDTV